MTASKPIRFTKCGSGQWRGATLAGRVWWITNRYAGTSFWELRLAENEDAHEGEVLADGKLAWCQREAQRLERERLAEEAALEPDVNSYDRAPTDPNHGGKIWR